MAQPDTGLSPLKHARREKLLDVAERLFTTQGFRATTMEGLAEAAGLSKVTVYGYFADKDAVFEAVAVRLAARLRALVFTALRNEGRLADRVGAALIAKHGLIFDLVRTSPFAAELMSRKADLPPIFQTLDDELIDAIAAVLDDRELAQLLFNASMGIANGAATRADMERHIGLLVMKLLADTNRDA
jgi:AcrR family transcriptional regulator